MKHCGILLQAFCLFFASNLYADGEQVLVFRNTGVVDLFYTDEVDSVLTNETGMVFYAKDTVLTVSYSELDSVAIGERNEMKFYEGVKELKKETDLPWIIRFDGQSIYYRNNTPSSVLPQVDTKLFYGLDGDRDGIFPFGLCAKVTNITAYADEIKVDIELVELEDIFERLFLAGPIQTEIEVPSSRRRVPVNAELNLDTGLDIGDIGSIEANGTLKVTGDVVLKRGYKHASLNLEYGYGMGVTLKASESTEYHIEELGSEAQIGTFYGLLYLDAAMGAFADMAAELTFGLDIERTYRRKLLWTQIEGENCFDFRDAGGNEPYEDNARFDLTLDGKVFFGPMAQIDFVTVGKAIGARAKVKAGTEIEGKVSLGMLQNMRNYQQQAYGNAELSFYGKVAVEGYTVNRHYLVWGDVDEHKIFSLPLTFGGHTMRLFPDYTHGNAVATTNRTENVTTDVAVAVEAPTPTNLETGFEIVDAQGEVVDSVFVGTIEAKPEDTTKAQSFDTEIVMPKTIRQEDMEGYTMRPIFHYAGYTISAAPVGIRKDVLLQPYSSTQSNGAMMFISSGPFLGSAIKDSTLYQVGMYLPVPLKDNVYKQEEGSSITIGTMIDGMHSNLFIGTWQGTVNDMEVTLTFNEDGMTGEYNGVPFTYSLNSPQSGDLLLMFEDSDPIVLRVLSITTMKLELIDKHDTNHTVWALTRTDY